MAAEGMGSRQGPATERESWSAGPTPPETGRLAGRPNKTSPERPTNEEGAAPIPHPIRNRAVEFFGLLCSPSAPKARAKRESTERRGGAAERLTRLPA